MFVGILEINLHSQDRFNYMAEENVDETNWLPLHRWVLSKRIWLLPLRPCKLRTHRWFTSCPCAKWVHTFWSVPNSILFIQINNMIWEGIVLLIKIYRKFGASIINFPGDMSIDTYSLLLQIFMAAHLVFSTAGHSTNPYVYFEYQKRIWDMFSTNKNVFEHKFSHTIWKFRDFVNTEIAIYYSTLVFQILEFHFGPSWHRNATVVANWVSEVTTPWCLYSSLRILRNMKGELISDELSYRIEPMAKVWWPHWRWGSFI